MLERETMASRTNDDPERGQFKGSLTKADSEPADNLKEMENQTVFNKLTYRAEVDGFRALAVIPVVLYHFDFGFPGGFAGVDVFFVISGFLIITLILSKIEAGKFSQKDFWMRRVRRLFPVLAVVTASALAYGLVVLPEKHKEKLQADVRYVLLFGANIHFFIDQTTVSAGEKISGYFDEGPLAPDEEEAPPYKSPFLHCWSLATEEQFYFVMPIVLVALLWLCKTLKFGSDTGARYVFVTMLLLFTGSLYLSVSFGYDGNDVTSVFGYYMLPTRMWEMIMGGFFAFKRQGGRLASSSKMWVKEIMATTGVALVATSYFIFSKTTPYPGGAAMVPCVGTMLFFESQVTGLSNFWGRLFALDPVVYIGKISYALYVWHWPIAVFVTTYYSLPQWRNDEDEAVQLADTSVARGIGVGLSFTLAVLSFTTFENYLRKPANVHDRLFYPSVLLVWVALMIVTFLPLVGDLAHPISNVTFPVFPGNNTTLNLTLSEHIEVMTNFSVSSLRYPSLYLTREEDPWRVGWSDLYNPTVVHQLPEAVFWGERSNINVDVIAVGSSHCNMYMPLLAELAEKYDAKLGQMCMSAGTSYVDEAGMPQWATNDFSVLRSHQPDRILWIERWGALPLFDAEEGTYPYLDTYALRLNETLDTLVDIAADKVVVLAGSPELSSPYGSRHRRNMENLYRQYGNFNFLEEDQYKPRYLADTWTRTQQVFKMLQDYSQTLDPEKAAKIEFIETKQYFVENEADRTINYIYPPTNRFIYNHDDDHLNYDGTKKLEWELSDVISPGSIPQLRTNVTSTTEKYVSKGWEPPV